MSTIFTPPWTMGNGVGMGTMPTFDLTVHGHRGGKLLEALRTQMVGQLVGNYSQESVAKVYSLRKDPNPTLVSQLLSELTEL